ncbi:MAG TPA: hypothetical protein VGK30_03870 [Candidatus Binatia bacterium]
MFKEEARLMFLVPFALMILALLGALIIPSYIGRARKAACYQRGGAWIEGRCEPPENRPPEP